MIEVRNLTKRYDDHLAVNNLSFTVDRGQILGFLGPNGAGKSTTMNILTGYIAPTEGTILINGFDMVKKPEKAKNCLGYLPEQPPVYPDMKVREYLDFVAELKGFSDKKVRVQAVEEAMEKTGITDVSERLIRHLSKGFKQRVGIAQAIVTRPEIVILDEPTVGLDPVQIIEIRELIKSFAKEHTVILSSHILSEISAVCDTVMIINKGKLIVSDTAEGLSKHLNVRKGLKLTVKGDAAKAKEILSGMDGVEEAEIVKEGEEGSILNVYTAQDADVREAVYFELASAHIAVLEQAALSMDLEEMFLEFIKESEEGETDESNL
ncbi:MAG: ABC transporter ATP-binding protein [Lachnospiraceae bacterium]|nr:ABC transporter ATP-binding protein [Lachnospiraceae bacterium]